MGARQRRHGSAEQATARCRATDKMLHQRRSQPVPRTRARGVGHAGRETGAGCEGTSGTRRSSPAAPDLSGEHDEPLRAAPREFRVACDFAPAGRVLGEPRARVSPMYWAACASEGGMRVVAASEGIAASHIPACGLVAARVLERKCGVRERRVAANQGSRARVLRRRPHCLRHGHKRPNPVELPSLPQRAGARQVLLLASNAAPARPRAHAQARQRLRGSVRRGPAARPPTRPSRLQTTPARLKAPPKPGGKKATARAASQASPSSGP